jgi:hypothetical protein
MANAVNNTPRSSFNPAALAASLGAGISSAATTEQSSTKGPPATIYIAIGELREGVDINAEGFEFDPVKHLNNLPQMQGLDNMKPDERKASTQEFADQQAERNDFLSNLVENALTTMQPGETRLVNLYVTLYRKKEEVVAAPVQPRQRRTYL